MSSVVSVDEQQRVSAVQLSRSCRAFWDKKFLAVSGEQEAVVLWCFPAGTRLTRNTFSTNRTSWTCDTFWSGESSVPLIPFRSRTTSLSSSTRPPSDALKTWTSRCPLGPWGSFLSWWSLVSSWAFVSWQQHHLPGYVLPPLASPPRWSWRSS